METAALEHLMGAYLHQDFEITGTIEENIDAFIAETPNLAPQLPREVGAILAADPTESQLDALLTDLGCQLGAPGDITYREWLTQIAERVRAATAGGA